MMCFALLMKPLFIHQTRRLLQINGTGDYQMTETSHTSDVTKIRAARSDAQLIVTWAKEVENVERLLVDIEDAGNVMVQLEYVGIEKEDAEIRLDVETEFIQEMLKKQLVILKDCINKLKPKMIKALNELDFHNG